MLCWVFIRTLFWGPLSPKEGLKNVFWWGWKIKLKHRHLQHCPLNIIVIFLELRRVSLINIVLVLVLHTFKNIILRPNSRSLLASYQQYLVFLCRSKSSAKPTGLTFINYWKKNTAFISILLVFVLQKKLVFV